MDKLPPTLKEALVQIASIAPNAMLVGGAVRDMILGSSFIGDIDIVTDEDPLLICQGLVKVSQSPVSIVPLDSQRGIYRIVLDRDPGLFLDICRVQSGSLVKDLGNRDFRINAMALPVESALNSSLQGLVDPLGGLGDLKAGILRTCSPDSFVNDPVRILRAFRFRVSLNMRLTSDSLDLAARSAQGLSDISGERIRDELANIFHCKKTHETLSEMAAIGVIDQLFEGLKSMRSCSQNDFHHLDVWEHSLEAIGIFESIERNLSFWFGPMGRPFSEYLSSELTHGRSRVFLIKMALLFHDAGKPPCRSIDSSGRVRFYGHERVSEELFLKAAERLKLSNREIRMVSSLILLHMRTSILSDPNCSDRAMWRLVRKAGEELRGLCLLFLSDLEATRGERSTAHKRYYSHRGALSLLDYATKSNRNRVEKLIDGHDLMRIFRMARGPDIGIVLERLEEAQAMGLIRNRKEALIKAEAILKTIRG